MPRGKGPSLPGKPGTLAFVFEGVALTLERRRADVSDSSSTQGTQWRRLLVGVGNSSRRTEGLAMCGRGLRKPLGPNLDGEGQNWARCQGHRWMRFDFGPCQLEPWVRGTAGGNDARRGKGGGEEVRSLWMMMCHPDTAAVHRESHLDASSSRTLS